MALPQTGCYLVNPLPGECRLRSAPLFMRASGGRATVAMGREMLYAAAEAHPSWEVLPNGMGIRHVGSEWPNTPQELLEWFLKKGRH